MRLRLLIAARRAASNHALYAFSPIRDLGLSAAERRQKCASAAAARSYFRYSPCVPVANPFPFQGASEGILIPRWQGRNRWASRSASRDSVSQRQDSAYSQNFLRQKSAPPAHHQSEKHAPGGVRFSAKSLINWSGREDSNLRPPHPQCDALPGCATSRPARVWPKPLREGAPIGTQCAGCKRLLAGNLHHRRAAEVRCAGQ